MKNIKRNLIIMTFMLVYLSIFSMSIYANEAMSILKYRVIIGTDKKDYTFTNGNYKYTQSRSNDVYGKYNLKIYPKTGNKIIKELKDIDDAVVTSLGKVYYLKSEQYPEVKLYEYDAKIKKERLLTTQESNGTSYIEAVVGKKIFFQINYTEVKPFEKYPLVTYDLSTREAVITDNVNATNYRFGKNKMFYRVIKDYNNISSIYDLKSANLDGSNEKNIAKNIIEHEAVGSRLYYAQRPTNNEDDTNLVIYSINENGKSKKAMTKKFECEWILKMTDKYVIYANGKIPDGNPAFYKLTFATGKSSQVSI